MLYSREYHSPIGSILLAADEQSLKGLWMKGQKYFCPLKEEIQPKESLPVLEQAADWLDRYFRGECPSITELNLAPDGSEFWQEIWKILCEIPYGQVITYGEIAAQIAEKMGAFSMSAQAVGGAVGHNPISIIIPCHRVVGSRGNLTGYAGGLEKKIWLLKHEGLDMERFFVPKKGLLFRKAEEADLPAVAAIYSEVHTAEEEGKITIGWVREIYPTAETAERALERDDLFVAEDDGVIVGTAIINQIQVDVYKDAAWKQNAPDEKVMVLHTLVISPKTSGKGYGKAFVHFYEEYARANGCPWLRMDTIAVNARARALYKKLGYEEIDILPCVLNGIENVPLVMLEKTLE